MNNKTNPDSWLHFKEEAVLHDKCAIVNIPLSTADQAIMEKLIAYVKWSQDPEKCDRPAVGIAANQIGVSKQMFYIRYKLRPEDDYIEYAFINPEIIQKSTGMTYLARGEGCLSVKDNDSYPGFVPRHYKIKVQGYNYLKGKNETLELIAHSAIIFQHEFDHLQGHLYYERINKKNPEFSETDWIAL